MECVLFSLTLHRTYTLRPIPYAGGLGGSADPVDTRNVTAPTCPDAVSDFRLRILLLGLRSFFFFFSCAV